MTAVHPEREDRASAERDEQVVRMAEAYFAKCAEFSHPSGITTLETLNPVARRQVLECFRAALAVVSPLRFDIEHIVVETESKYIESDNG